jgi:mono/diheme cytochrome c family protein
MPSTLAFGQCAKRFRYVAAVVLALATTPSSAADSPGQTMYLRYCGACHGPNGKGDGVAGTFMRPKPTDLTQLAKANGGTFAFQKVAAYIDGTTDVRAHGDPTMPVWGEMFKAEAGWDQTRRAEAKSKVQLITDYVRSIQAP